MCIYFNFLVNRRVVGFGMAGRVAGVFEGHPDELNELYEITCGVRSCDDELNIRTFLTRRSKPFAGDRDQHLLV